MQPAFLLSFCNLDVVQSRRCLGVVEEPGERWLIETPELDIWQTAGGASGVCRLPNGNLLVGIQGPEVALELGPGLGLRAVVPTPGARDLHGLCSTEAGLVIAATGNDAILRVNPRTGVSEIVFATGADADTIHINDLIEFEGRLLASAFGERRGDGVRSGSIFDVNTRDVLVSGLREPHSLCAHNGALYFLESATGILHCYRTGEGVRALATFAGYVRGLAVTDAHVAVGRSAYRPRSRSKPGFDRTAPFDSRAADDKEHAISGLYIGDREGRAFKFVDLSDIAGEIYSVTPIDMTLVRRDLLLAEGERVRNRDLVMLVDQMRATIRMLQRELADARKPR